MTDFDETGANDHLVIQFDRREVTGQLLTEAEFEDQKTQILAT